MSNNVTIEGKNYTEREILSFELNGEKVIGNGFYLDGYNNGEVIKANFEVSPILNEKSDITIENSSLNVNTMGEREVVDEKGQSDTIAKKSFFYKILDGIKNIVKKIRRV